LKKYTNLMLRRIRWDTPAAKANNEGGDTKTDGAGSDDETDGRQEKFIPCVQVWSVCNYPPTL
jgi:hypothetical protein